LFDVAGFEGLFKGRQHFAAGVRYEHIIFDAHAAFAGKIDAGLDGDDHSRAKLFIAAGVPHRGQLVNISSDAVAQAVAELILEAGLVDDIARDAIGLHRGHAWPDERDRRQLRFQHELVYLLHPLADAAKHERASKIRAIAAIDRAPI